MQQSEELHHTSGQTVEENIRDAGYEPSAPNGIPDEVKKDIVADALNRKTETAYIHSIDGDDTTVEVEYRLPYGGTFTQQYERPDKTTDTTHPELELLLDEVNIEVDEIDDLPVDILLRVNAEESRALGY